MSFPTKKKKQGTSNVFSYLQNQLTENNAPFIFKTQWHCALQVRTSASVDSTSEASRASST